MDKTKIRILDILVQTNGLLVLMNDGSQWIYSKGAELEWRKVVETKEEMEESFNKFYATTNN